MKTICYFGIGDMHYSRNKVFSDALKGRGMEVIECTTKKTGLSRYYDLWKKHRALKHAYDAMIVNFPGFIIAPFARLIARKKVILDALSSRYDSDIISRNAHEGSFWKKAKILLIDWLAFKAAHLILVETESQKDFISRRFNIPKSKIAVVYTGVDETVFREDASVHKHPVFTAIFRGRIMSEAGVPVILKAAEILKDEDVHFDLVGYGWGPWIEESRRLYAKLDHAKVHWDEKEIPIDELIQRMQRAHVSLGQFGKSERLDRTIPHKAFESMLLGVPFITARSRAVGEILKDGESCVMIPENNPEALARAILELKNDPSRRQMIASSAKKAYDALCSSQRLGDMLLVAMADR